MMPLLIKHDRISAQNSVKATELLIIGIKHDGNRNFSHRTLYKLLKEANPDIILWEQSTDFQKVPGLRTANFLQIWKPGIEQLAIQKYLKHNKKIRVLPFDTTIKERRKYIKELTELEGTFFRSLAVVKKNTKDSINYHVYQNKRKHYFTKLEAESLEKLNEPEIYTLAKEIYELDESFILPLSKYYFLDATLINKFEKEHTFWLLRNEFMVKKIKKYMQEYTGKKIVVLTGLNHKYYLIEKLTQNKTEYL